MGGTTNPNLRATLLDHLSGDRSLYPARLEQQFPRILDRIVGMWGTSDLDYYLESLMISDRTDRQGFPHDIAMEIFRLSVAHGALGLSSKVSGTGWAGIDDGEFFRKSIKHG